MKANHAFLFPSDRDIMKRALGNLGGFIGPYLVGFITTNVGQNVAIYTLVGFLLLASVITFSLPRSTEGKMEAKGYQVTD